jgi:hypothetical protein
MGSHRHCRCASVDRVLTVSQRIGKASGERLSLIIMFPLDEESTDAICGVSAMKRETKLTEREQLELQERRSMSRETQI